MWLDADQLSDQELIRTYKAQGSVERGFSFLKDLIVSGLLRLREEPDPHRGAQLGHGPVPLGLSARRAPAACAPRRHRPDGPQPAQAANGSADAALDVPVLRRRESGRVPATTGTTPPGTGRSGALALAGGHLIGASCERLYKLDD